LTDSLKCIKYSGGNQNQALQPREEGLSIYFEWLPLHVHSLCCCF